MYVPAALIIRPASTIHTSADTVRVRDHRTSGKESHRRLQPGQPPVRRARPSAVPRRLLSHSAVPYQRGLAMLLLALLLPVPADVPHILPVPVKYSSRSRPHCE